MAVDDKGNEIGVGKETDPTKIIIDKGSVKTDAEKDAELKTLIQQGIDDALKGVKENLDSAYAARDAALAVVKTFEEKDRAIEIKRLEDEGKHKELYDKLLAEKDTELASAQKTNVELTRDVAIRAELNKYTFRNNSALEMAFKEVSTGIIQDANGLWVHQSGATVPAHIKAFTENTENGFLIKAKESSGSGLNTDLKTFSGKSGSEGSIFAMDQSEVIKLAAEGKLRRKRG